jgi:uncharacterized pyridoxamine 5'-phosphate oxidase family protein
MDEVYEFFKKARTYYIATSEDGQPRVRPFGTVDVFDGKLYIQTGRSKDVYKQMLADPRIELCAFDGEMSWVRVSAKAVTDDNIEAEKHMLDAYPELAGRYQPGDGNNVVLYLADATASFYSFAGTDDVDGVRTASF